MIVNWDNNVLYVSDYKKKKWYCFLCRKEFKMDYRIGRYLKSIRIHFSKEHKDFLDKYFKYPWE